MADFLAELRKILGPGGLLTDLAARTVYARDASHLTGGRPVAVALPPDTDRLRQAVRQGAEAGIPMVCRGTGTGLSGGAVPDEGALVLGTTRLSDLGAVDAFDRRVRVQPGVLNEMVSRHAAAAGLHFAPDPSSQAAASIGGNVAENAGGPHCLRHGVTLQHLRNVEWCNGAGRRLLAGRGLAAERGLHLTSLLCGSEGTLGVVTEVDLNLVPDPEASATLLAFFPDLCDAARAVVALLGRGLAPVAVEMVDQAMLVAVEAAFGFGFATDVEAAMIVEFAGRSEEVAEDGDRAAELLADQGAREVRLAADATERHDLWQCRKKAFGAVGRLAPNYVTMDVVVPLGELPPLVHEIQDLKAAHGVEIATAFHAGDGNLHPGVHYDDRDPEQTRRAHAAADAIIRAALARGGSITGEHGVGIEKLHALPWQLDAETARLQRGLKDIFDPAGIFNPGKLHPPASAAYAPVKPVPAGIDFRWDHLTVTAPATTAVADLQAAALERDLWLPVGLTDGRPAADGNFGLGSAGTVGDLVADLWPGPALCPGGTTRDILLELWANTGDGRLFHTGAPVFKNVAGYDLAHLLCGSGRTFVEPRAATFQLRPVPEALACWRLPLTGGAWPTQVVGLLEYLNRRDQGLGGPVAVIDAAGNNREPEALVVVPGRRRDWDLGRVGQDLARLFPDGSPDPIFEAPFARGSELLASDLLPDWSVATGDWTVWAPRPQRDPATGKAWPTGLIRGIWQAAPALVWSPEGVDARPGWHGDRWAVAGEVQPVGPPGREVPREELAEIKDLFDPDGLLASPAWLEDRHG